MTSTQGVRNDRNIAAQTRYDALGRAYEIVDALGFVTHTDYDGLGRPTTATRNYVAGGPVNQDTNVRTQHTYDALGQVTIRTDPTNAASQAQYDQLGHTVRVYDPLNRETRLGYDGQGTLRWSRRADGRLTVYEFDGLGRVVATILAYEDGVAGWSTSRDIITRTLYDVAGRRVKTTDPQGTETAFSYDLVDRLVGVTENVVTGTCQATDCNVVTRYDYDRAGNRIAIVDARGNIRRFSYDAADRQKTTVDALGRTTSWWYDRGGRLEEQQDPRGILLEYHYDGMDRVRQIYAVDFSGSIEFEYDALGRRTHSSAPDGNGPTNYLYDALGRIKQVTTMDSGTVGYDYDARGARTGLTYPDGSSTQYSYYADGLLKEVLRNGTSLAYYSYNAVGQLELVYANDSKHLLNYGYDWADRLTNIFTYGNLLNGIYQQLGHLDYTYNRAGQRTQVSEQFGLQTRQISYAYDGLGRLSGASTLGGNSYNYAYDKVGNRTEVRLNNVVTEQHSYNSANQVSDAGWSYDATGNLLNDGTTSYTYNALNQVDSVTTGGLARHYRYNADGVLVSEMTGGVETRYTQDLASPLSQVLQTTQGGTTIKYLYGLERLAAESNGVRTWYSEDALGSVRMTLNDAGATIATASYDVWGKPEQGLIAPFGFTGELQDSVTGLVNLRARWYDTGHGTFTAYRWRTSESNDRNPYSHHPYAYALGNPVLFTDPTGKCVDERVPIYGEPGCRVEDGVLKGQLDWAAGQAYVEGIVNTVSECGAGIFKQWAYDNTFGLAEDAAPQSGESAQMSICRHAGNAIAAVQGAAEIVVGAAGVGGSGLACVGTFGLACAPAGLVAGAGAAVAAHGAGVLGAAVGNEAGLIVNGMRACATMQSQGGGGIGRGNGKTLQLGRDYTQARHWIRDGYVEPNNYNIYPDPLNDEAFPHLFNEAAEKASFIEFDVKGLDFTDLAKTFEAVEYGDVIRRPSDMKGKRFTDYELYTILNDRKLLAKTTFKRGNQILQGEELKNFFHDMLQAGWKIP